MARMKNRELIERFREVRDRIGIFHMDFHQVPESREELVGIGKEMERRFLLWWDSWIKPLIDEVERKLTRNSHRRKQGKLFPEEDTSGGTRKEGQEASNLDQPASEHGDAAGGGRRRRHRR